MLFGSGVREFERLMSKAAAVSRMSVPGGWYLMPASYCRLEIGSGIRPAVPKAGSKMRPLTIGSNASL